MIWSAPGEKQTFDQQQDANVLWLGQQNLRDIAPGTVASVVNTSVAGPLPWGVVPGDSIAAYTAASYSSNSVRDVYILDESTIDLPYLGAAGPTVLDIPIGISGQLTHLFIIFVMNGLACRAPAFSGKVRIKQ
jgi:hypothetical protein